MYYSTAKQMEKLDQLAVKNGLEIRQMMELAGFAMVDLFSLLKIRKNYRISVVAGKGNKGGDGLAAARHLYNHGWKKINIILISKKIKPDPKHHLNLLKKMKIPISLFPAASKVFKQTDIFIDALIGYQLSGSPRGDFAKAIELMNKSKKKIIAYDLPSGTDPSLGRCYKPCIKAFATLSLALPKKIFRTRQGLKVSGRLFLADIGIPVFLYDKIIKRSRPDFKDKILVSL